MSGNITINVFAGNFILIVSTKEIQINIFVL